MRLSSGYQRLCHDGGSHALLEEEIKYAQHGLKVDERSIMMPLLLGWVFDCTLMLLIRHSLTAIPQYEVAVDSNPRVCQKTPLIRQICYGILHEILVCTLPTSNFLGTNTPTTHLLALISNCGTHEDAAITQASFMSLSEMTQIIALASVSSVCGRFRYGTTSPWWAIVDHSIELTRPIFNVDDDWLCTITHGYIRRNQFTKYNVSHKLQFSKHGNKTTQPLSGGVVIHNPQITINIIVNNDLHTRMWCFTTLHFPLC